ncbi:hypothetical protein D3C87_1564060 [compost metagenome]
MRRGGWRGHQSRGLGESQYLFHIRGVLQRGGNSDLVFTRKLSQGQKLRLIVFSRGAAHRLSQHRIEIFPDAGHLFIGALTEAEALFYALGKLPPTGEDNSVIVTVFL